MFSTPFIDIPPLDGAQGTLVLPGSKSISNRLLLLAALAEGTTTLHDLLDSDDTRVMLNALASLGCVVRQQGSTVEIDGMAGQLLHSEADLFMGNAGTAIRPLTAALSVLGGNFKLHGVPRMHERPIGDLVDALRQLGCQIDYQGQDGYPPLLIGKPTLTIEAPIRVRGDVSSQFLTALLMALPLVAEKDIVIEVVGELISRPYIEITLNLLGRFGVHIVREDWQRFTIPAGCKLRSPGTLYVEADASSASYFIALGAIASKGIGRNGVRIEGVGLDSIQGDIRFIDAARLMGAEIHGGPNWLEITRGAWPLKAIDLDCNHIPDAAMTLAVMALYADGTTTLRNIASWRVKETDRIAAMATELRKLGATVEEGADFIRVTPPASAADWKAASIHTYDDHRVAMCFSLAAFNPGRLPVRIEDPKCVAKTYPDYFEALFSLSQNPARCGAGDLCGRPDGVRQRHAGCRAGQGTRLSLFGLWFSVPRHGIGCIAEWACTGRRSGGCHCGVAQIAGYSIHRRASLGRRGDVSDAIRTEEAGMNASKVSVFPKVRHALIDLQHRFRRLPGLVADGRDMGTIIFPDALAEGFPDGQCRKASRAAL